MPESSDGKTENVTMSVALEMKSSIVSLAGARSDCDTRESMIARAARRAGIGYRIAKAFYYGETANPRSDAVEKVRAAVRQTQEQKARREASELAIQIARLEATLRAIHPDLDRQDLDRVRAAAFGALAENGVGRSALDNGEE
jgi:hypothetical protein